MPKRYLTDGTGRDGYIFTNDGGQTSSGKHIVMDPRIIFQRNLRSYQRDDNYLERHNRITKFVTANTKNPNLERPLY